MQHTTLAYIINNYAVIDTELHSTSSKLLIKPHSKSYNSTTLRNELIYQNIGFERISF